MRNHFTGWAVVGVVAFLGLGAGNASASSGTLAVGACQKGSTKGTVAYRWEGMFNINPSENLGVDCSVPLADDHVSIVDLYYADNSTTEQVICQLKLVDTDGDVEETGATKKSGLAAVNAQGMFRWSNFVQDGYIPYVACSLPKGADDSTASGVHGMNVGAQ